MYWFPVAMGVATKAEIDVASVPDLQFYNEVAYQKYLLMHGGGGENG